MSLIYKVAGVMLLVSSALIQQANAAACPRCVKIEAEREKQGPQPIRYYDDYLKDQQVSLADETSPPMSTAPRLSATGSSVNTGATDPANRTGVSGSTDYSAQSRINTREMNRDVDRDININRSLDVTIIPERSYSTVFVILNSGDFIKTLRGPFTLFIPSNEALRSLPPGTLQDLLRPENRELLSKLVGNHLVAQKLTSLKDKPMITTVNGKKLIVGSQNGVETVDGARVIRSENIGDNGVVYIIDTVLLNQ